MTATLTIRVKNETRQDLAGIVDSLDESKVSAEGLGESLAESSREASVEIARLSKEQAHEIRMIHEQRAAWSSLATTAIPAISSVTVASLKYAGALAQIAAQQKAIETLLAPLAGSQRAWNATVNLAERTAVRGAASLAGYGAAAASVASGVLGATLAVKGLETTLAHTGVRTTAFGEVETNLDRARAATQGLKDDLSALAGEGVTEIRRLTAETAAWAYEASGLKAGWQEFDRQITERTDSWVVNARALGSAIRGVSRDAVEASKAIEAAQNEARDDFDRVREANDAVERAATYRAEAERIAGLNTTQAIDTTIAKLQEQRGIQAANNQFDEAAQKKYLSDVERLESRRSQLLDQRKREEDAERTKRVAEEKKASGEIIRLHGLAYDAKNKAILKENADYEKALHEEVQAIIRQGQEQQKIAAQVTANQQKEHTARQQAYVAKWKETVDRIAAIINGKNAGGGAVDQIRAGISQRDVARQVGDNRAAAAEREFRESGEGKRREEALMARGVDRDQAERRVLAQQRALRDQARARGFADTMRGRNGDEAAHAQNQLIQATAQQAAASGELAPVVAQGLMQAARQAIQATQDAQQAKAVALQVLETLNANGQRMRSINGSLK